jgi:hypothetical protein
VRDGRVRWRPAVDVTRVITTAEVVVGGVLIAHRMAARPSGATALVRMGPGGWVSMRGRRPVWARHPRRHDLVNVRWVTPLGAETASMS